MLSWTPDHVDRRVTTQQGASKAQPRLQPTQQGRLAGGLNINMGLGFGLITIFSSGNIAQNIEISPPATTETNNL